LARYDRDRLLEIVGRQIARIHLLAIDDARIVAQRHIELPVTDVDRIRLRRAALQHHVREPARRCADVRTHFSLHIDRKFFERVRELHPPAPHPRMLELRDAQLVVLADTGPRLVDERAIYQHAPRHDQRLRLRARLDETARDQREVETLLVHSLTRWKPACAKWWSFDRT